MRRFIVIGLLFACFSCAPSAKQRINNEMISWVGKHQSELIGTWGKPSLVEDGQNGEKLLIYEISRKSAKTTKKDIELINRTIVETTDNSYVARRTFWVDKSGIILRWAWKGY